MATPEVTFVIAYPGAKTHFKGLHILRPAKLWWYGILFLMKFEKLYSVHFTRSYSTVLHLMNIHFEIPGF